MSEVDCRWAKQGHMFITGRGTLGALFSPSYNQLEYYDWHPLQNHIEGGWSRFANERQIAATIRRERKMLSCPT